MGNCAGRRMTSGACNIILGKDAAMGDVLHCVEAILRQGSIQLTTAQRKKMVEEKKLQIINDSAQLILKSNVIDIWSIFVFQFARMCR